MEDVRKGLGVAFGGSLPELLEFDREWILQIRQSERELGSGGEGGFRQSLP